MLDNKPAVHSMQRIFYTSIYIHVFYNLNGSASVTDFLCTETSGFDTHVYMNPRLKIHSTDLQGLANGFY